jgi:hypothetical protein
VKPAFYRNFILGKDEVTSSILVKGSRCKQAPMVYAVGAFLHPFLSRVAPSFLFGSSLNGAALAANIKFSFYIKKLSLLFVIF